MADKSKVKLREFNLIYDFEDVGYLVSAQTQASPGSQYVDVTNAAQFNGVLKSWTNGYIPTVQIQMLETDYQRLFGRLGGEQFRAIVDGAKLSWGIGSRVKELLGKMTILRPVGADAGDYAEDIAFWKGIPDFSQVQITGNRDEANVVTVPFKILPDDTQNIDWTYGRIGDWTAVDTAPGGIFAQFDFAVKHPYKHIPAVTLDSNSKLHHCWSFDYGICRGSKTRAQRKTRRIFRTTAYSCLRIICGSNCWFASNRPAVWISAWHAARICRV